MVLPVISEIISSTFPLLPIVIHDVYVDWNISCISYISINTTFVIYGILFGSICPEGKNILNWWCATIKGWINEALKTLYLQLYGVKDTLR